MGGIFGVCLNDECAKDLFFGIDYHSHLGTKRGGMAVFDGKKFNRAIHNIQNTPFRTKFEEELPDMKGHMGIGCISDDYPQPIILSTRIGTIAVTTVGKINNKKEIMDREFRDSGVYFTEMSDGTINDTELVASLICSKDEIKDGINYAHSLIDGSRSMIIATRDGIYAARDKYGRTPLFIGKKSDGSGYCASMESFAYGNMGYETYHELGPAEIVYITSDRMVPIQKPLTEMKMCTFLWLYYGFPTSDYEGCNVEEMRNRCGASMAEQDKEQGTAVEADYVAGVPDSGTPHAIGYANQSHIPFARPLLKYTPTWPRSFTVKEKSLRQLVAKMKLTPAVSLIKDKKLIFMDDSIVRGTQLGGLMDTLFSKGAKELHGRIGCPPLVYNCKYLNFTRSASEDDNIARRAIKSIEGVDKLDEETLAKYTEFGSESYRKMLEYIRENLNFTSLEYLSLDRMLETVGIDKCKLCTYCWNGKE